MPIRKVRSGKRRWLLDLRYVGGRRQFYETKEQAQAVRDAKFVEVKNHGAAALSLTDDDRLDFVRARDRLAEVGADIAKAVAFYLEHHSQIEPINFGDAIERVSATKLAAKKDGEYVRKMKSTLNSLCLSCGGPDVLLSRVTADQIEGWLFSEENGWKQDTIRNKRIDVRTFFRFAHRKHWLVTNPAQNLEAVERTTKPPGILKVDECRALLVACREGRPEFLPYLVLGLFCGVRCEEVVMLCPENLRIDRGFVEVPAYRGDEPIAKSRKRRIIPLSKNACAWLKGAAPLLTRTAKWYARQLPKLRAVAAPLIAKAPGVEPGSFPWPKNCLRHSFASYHIAMHENAGVTATLMGHDGTDMLFDHYRELVTKDEAERFWAIEPVTS
jgi:integrase